MIGSDILCQAKSGMGKTAVFVVSVLQQLEPVEGKVSVLVLCHTRELAFQVLPSPAYTHMHSWHLRACSSQFYPSDWRCLS